MNFFRIEVFPRLGSSYAPVNGTIHFQFQKRSVYICTEGQPRMFEETTGVTSFRGSGGYTPTFMYLEKTEDLVSPFLEAEVICDVISLAINHLGHFSTRMNEYSFPSGYGIGEFQISQSTRSLNHGASSQKTESSFIDENLVTRIIGQIQSSRIKDRLLSSLHLNRLSKTKSDSHLTESLTDAVCSVEAIYMIRNHNRDDQLDRTIIDSGIAGKSNALKYFLTQYCSDSSYAIDQQYISNFIEELNPYGIRSAYLHRGARAIGIEKDSFMTTTDIRDTGITQKLYELSKLIFHSIQNFVIRN